MFIASLPSGSSSQNRKCRAVGHHLGRADVQPIFPETRGRLHLFLRALKASHPVWSGRPRKSGQPQINVRIGHSLGMYLVDIHDVYQKVDAGMVAKNTAEPIHSVLMLASMKTDIAKRSGGFGQNIAVPRDVERARHS